MLGFPASTRSCYFESGKESTREGEGAGKGLPRGGRLSRWEKMRITRSEVGQWDYRRKAHELQKANVMFSQRTERGMSKTVRSWRFLSAYTKISERRYLICYARDVRNEDKLLKLLYQGQLISIYSLQTVHQIWLISWEIYVFEGKEFRISLLHLDHVNSKVHSGNLSYVLNHLKSCLH